MSSALAAGLVLKLVIWSACFCCPNRNNSLGVNGLKAKENADLKKEVINIFKANGLNINISINKRTISFRNVTLNLPNFSMDNHV